MDFYKLIYGSRYSRYKIYDIALSYFKNADCLSFYDLEKAGKYPPDFHSVFDFLASEGMCKISKYGICITEKGKVMMLNGGYIRDLLRQRLTFLSVIIAIAGGIVAIISCFF